MIRLGEEGYIKETRHIISAQIKVRKTIKSIPMLYVYGQPRISVVTFNSYKYNIYDICDQMTKRGWHLTALQNPPGPHFTSTIPLTDAANEFIMDLKDVMQDFEDGLVKEGSGSVANRYRMVTTVPVAVVAEAAGSFVDALYKP
ncbi:hypothetical protein BGX23_007775 [Mortierella sp. AD031]|nr:hypothetical protein BGX23_007775 [Mortierella sp. AD031]